MFDIRMNEEAVLRNVFVKAKVLATFLDNFVQYDVIFTDGDEVPASSIDLKSVGHVSKIAVRGIIMNCCNAVRLQAAAMPSSCFLRQYLKSVGKWNKFIPQLCLATEFQQHHGMGLKVC